MVERNYQSIPPSPSALGHQAYQWGRRLVADRGLRLPQIVWDADEILWNWLLRIGDVTDHLRALVTGGESAHREWFLVKPGIFELLWGMRHASLERGLDPHVRIWTDGYPWRLGRIAREIPGFAELLGPPAETTTESHAGFDPHPRIFYRKDYAEVVGDLIGSSAGEEFWSELDPDARRVLGEQFERDPLDSTLKLPELAGAAGKPGFERAEILVDDRPENVERFVETGRRGIRVVSDVPGLFFDRVPNAVWREPRRRLRQLDDGIVPALARHLDDLARTDAAGARTARPTHLAAESHASPFEIEVPGEIVHREWWQPIRRLAREIDIGAPSLRTAPSE
ncbi:MAG: hypothetical protein ABEL76_08290 [Bradymonadaceae bacterium]